MGNGRTPFCVLSTLPRGIGIRRVELVYDKALDEFRLHVAVSVKAASAEPGNKTAGVGLGVIHSMVVTDGKETIIYNGGELNSKLCYRNKKLAEFSHKLSRKKRSCSTSRLSS